MRGLFACLLSAALLIASACGGESEPKPLLRIEDQQFELEDFQDFLRAGVSTDELTLDSELLPSYLDIYKEHKLLVYGATQAGVVPPREVVGTIEREKMMISIYLAQEALKPERQMRVEEGAVHRLYDELYTDDRVVLNSIFVESESDARRIYRELRSRPSSFARYMERYNSEQVREDGRGQGEHARRQLPEDIREAVFSVEQTPRILEPLVYQNGYLIIMVQELLPRPGLEDVREELERVILDDQRMQLRRQLIAELSGSVDFEFNKDIAIAALAGPDGG